MRTQDRCDTQDQKFDPQDRCDQDVLLSMCGYCGEIIDYCQGHGEDERAEYGFEFDSDEYETRRDAFEAMVN